VNFAYEVSLFISVVFLTFLKIFPRGTDGFTSPKEVVPRIFIAIKYPTFSAGFEPVYLGSSNKHANH
jgi:hypothetical protein